MAKCWRSMTKKTCIDRSIMVTMTRGIWITHVVLSVVYVVMGAVIFGFGYSDQCAPLFSTSNSFRTAAGTDNLGWNLPFFDLSQNVYTLSIFPGIGLMLEGVLLSVIVWPFFGINAEVCEEIAHKSNRYRWIRYLIVDSLYFVAMFMIAGITDNILLSSVAVVAIALNMAQLGNEVDNAGAVNQKTGLLLESSEKQTSVKDPFATRPRIGMWLVATLVFAWYVTVMYVYMGNSEGSTPAKSLALIPIIWGAIYLVKHVLILLVFTNYQVCGTGGWKKGREYFFLFWRFLEVMLISLWIFIASFIDPINATCPK